MEVHSVIMLLVATGATVSGTWMHGIDRAIESKIFGSADRRVGPSEIDGVLQLHLEESDERMRDAPKVSELRVELGWPKGIPECPELLQWPDKGQDCPALHWPGSQSDRGSAPDWLPGGLLLAADG